MMLAEVVKIEVPAGTAFTQLGQPGAKADDEPFAQVERPEENALDPFQCRTDRFGHADFPWRMW